MAFAAFLNHTCDVYHILREDKSPGYGLPASRSFEYAEIPDLTGVRCHFCTKSGTRNIVQNAPQTAPNADYQASIKLVLPLGTDIRLNDKIIDSTTGYEYTAGIPIQIQQHHIFVMVRRTSPQEAL